MKSLENIEKVLNIDLLTLILKKILFRNTDHVTRKSLYDQNTPPHEPNCGYRCEIVGVRSSQLERRHVHYRPQDQHIVVNLRKKAGKVVRTGASALFEIEVRTQPQG